jgi:hypothetical protein
MAPNCKLVFLLGRTVIANIELSVVFSTQSRLEYITSIGKAIRGNKLEACILTGQWHIINRLEDFQLI